jgi:SAM-dependent methyltransferase
MSSALPRGSAEAGRVAAAVRTFYEQHPYPQPVDDLDRYQRRRHDGPALRAEHHLFWPGSAFREDRAVLIAGCGTSQAAKHALRWPRAKVTGIDVSSTSIRRTEALKAKYGLENLELEELPIERAPELGRSFDHIVCTGVLHHLPDPDAGLRALRQVLAPGGAMHLMVYAPYGRAGIYLLQEYCRRVGIGGSGDEIRDLAAVLRELPHGHPLRPLLGKSADFSNESGLADALLHPRDRPYSVPQFLELIARCGLRLQRWLRQAPYLPYCGAPLHSPHHSRLAHLGPKDQYAAMELFRGTMVRHSAIVHRNDGPGSGQATGQAIGFDDGPWLDYVAIRLPEAICVEERLPPGAAGVLINRNHTDTDIYLPIDAAQKRLYSEIDGRRSIRELIAGDATTETARSFFERLWWHDLVVFDSSQCDVLRGMET